MSQTHYDNDEMFFLEEDDSAPEAPSIERAWNVLVVDDDEEIHLVTKLALGDLELQGKGLSFMNAYSGEEALQILKDQGNKIAVVMLDVVMETDDAGLQVARKMREELNLHEPRIILRTGQPGYAPEERVIKDYDINDYKTKTELTRSKLVTTIIASLRSYQQIITINQSRVGLEKIVHSAANLLERHSVVGFCEGVVTQISSLMGIDASGVVCARAGSVLDQDDGNVYVLGAAGKFADYISKPLDTIHDEKIIREVANCLVKKQHIYGTDFTVLYMKSSGYEAAVFVQVNEEINILHKKLIEVFMSSISIGYENVNLFHQLRNAAFRDMLTKLPNRNEFINILDNERQTSDGNQVIALVDVNHFADVNDGLGQDAGNLLLIAIAERLKSHFGDSVKMGRIGADVFGLIGDSQKITPETISSIFLLPFKAGDHTLPINITMGFCKLEGAKATGLELLKQSNIALNLAKKNNTSNFEFYVAKMETETSDRLKLIRKLRHDFAERKLELWYQPQVDLLNDKVVGMEALLRWPDGDGGYISPVKFVPLAEYSGLIIEIGAWVLTEACRQLRELHDKGHSTLRVAINISMPQFRDSEFVGQVKNAVQDNRLDPDLVELEITESVVMDEPQIVVDSLKELKEFGVQIAVDDFGTGFSSMSYLQKLPLDRLKVDRAFVNEIQPDQRAFIAETIVTLGAKLGLKTIAEGVEKREQVSYLLKIGCDEAQGYLYAKPMPFNELVEFLSSYEP